MIKEITTLNVAPPQPMTNRQLGARLRSHYIRWFFVWMGSLFPVIAAVGFVPDYALMYSGTFHAHWFAHVHGAIMASWLFVFLAQAILAAKGNLRYHRKLGLLSVILGAAVWLSAVGADVRARIATSPPMGDSDSWNVQLIGICASTLFALFFTWGILARKNAAVHKRLLLLASIVILQAAVDRTRFLPGIGSAIYINFIYLDLLLIPILIYDFLTIQRIHKITLTGAVCLLVLQLAVVTAWDSPSWRNFAFSFFKPFMEQQVEIKLSDAQTDALTGNYGDEKWHLTISRVAGKLYLKLPGQDAWEMGAISETEWFLKTMTWRAIFIKGQDGKVMKIINRQPAITWEVQKMK
jgi:hypothetical protein